MLKGLWTPSLARCWTDALGATDHSSVAVPIWPEFADDPVGFYRDILGTEVWSSEREDRIAEAPADVRSVLETIPVCGQDDLLNALADPDNDHVCVVAAKGPGKTYALGRAPLWWNHTRANSVVVAVSTTGQQVKLQLFAHLEKALTTSRRALGGRYITSPVPLYSCGPGHYTVGLSPAIPEALQGWHAEAKKVGLAGPVLVIVDETSGIRDDILDACFGLLTNPGSRMVWSSNAKKARGRMFEVYNPLAAALEGVVDEDAEDDDEPTADDAPAAAEYKTALLRITAYDAPSWIIGDRWLRGAEARPGKRGVRRIDDPQFRYDTLGLFPTTDEDLLFPRPFLQAVSNNRPRFGGLHMGVDLGRHGKDPCIALLVENGIPVAIKRWSDPAAKRDLMRSAEIIRTLAVGLTWTDPEHPNRGWDVEPRNVHVDATGLGWGVVDRLWDMGIQCDAVDFGLGAEREELAAHRDYWRHVLGKNRPRLKYRRDDLYWTMRRAMEEGYAGVPAAAAFLHLWEELQAIEVEWKGDEFRLASKDKIIETLGHSPDYADAYAVSFSRADPLAVRLRALAPPEPGPRRPRSTRAARILRTRMGGAHGIALAA